MLEEETQKLATLLSCFDDDAFKASCAWQYARRYQHSLATVAEIAKLSPADLEAASRGREQPISIMQRTPAGRAKLLALAADEPSRAVINADFDALDDWFKRPPEDRPSVLAGGGESSEVRLRVNDRTVDIAYPRGWQSLLLLTEIFGEDDYAMHTFSDVPVIYDLGGNIGLSALYFAAHRPNVRVVCVEPSHKNLTYLRRNLERNKLNAEVLPVAVGAERGTLEFYEFDGHAVGSTVFSEFLGRGGTKLTVDSVPISDVVKEPEYGLKIDIEGGEYGLLGAPQVFENARWITGEIHFGADLDPAQPKTLLGILRRAFDMQFDEPLLAHRDVKAAQAFRGVRRR